jgi:hypothetical protein
LDRGVLVNRKVLELPERIEVEIGNALSLARFGARPFPFGLYLGRVLETDFGMSVAPRMPVACEGNYTGMHVYKLIRSPTQKLCKALPI